MAKIVVLSGAGISAESGISTFRDSDGLWEEYDVKEVCTAGCLVANRNATIEFYDKRRKELQSKQPNKAHWVLSKLKEQYKDDIAIITQNVDNLFEKADIAHDDVIHLHGYLREIKCEDCGLVYDIGYKKIQESFNGKCPTCSSKKIRPNIVMFGEEAPLYAKLYKELEDCELLIIIGTSGHVIDVDSLTKYAKKTILNNLEPSDAIDDSLYAKVLYKKATDAIDEIVKEIKDFSFSENKQSSSDSSAMDDSDLLEDLELYDIEELELYDIDDMDDYKLGNYNEKNSFIDSSTAGILKCFYLNHHQPKILRNIKDDMLNEIRYFQITAFELDTTLYGYQLIEPKLLLARLLYLIKKSRKNGILCLLDDNDVANETNIFMKELLCHTVHGGYIYSDYVKIIKLKLEGIKNSFLEYDASSKRQHFFDEICKQFQAIADGVFQIVGGSDMDKIISKFLERYPQCDFDLSNPNEISKYNEQYLQLNKPFVFLNKSDFSSLKNPIGCEELLDIFNNKRDAYESIELLILEDPQDLLNRFIALIELARKESYFALYPVSISDPNIFVRHLFQRIVFYEEYPEYQYIKAYKEARLKEAQKFYSIEFCKLYEREMNCIITLTDALMEHNLLEMITSWKCLYPEITLDTTYIKEIYGI